MYDNSLPTSPHKLCYNGITVQLLPLPSPNITQSGWSQEYYQKPSCTKIPISDSYFLEIQPKIINNDNNIRKYLEVTYYTHQPLFKVFCML